MPRFVRHITITLAVALLLVLVSASCKPKIGQKCQAGAVTCASDGRNALACGADLTLQLVPCKGPQGCVRNQTTKIAQCDDETAEEGDNCLVSASENWACSLDHKTALICKDGKFKLKGNCRGPSACTVKRDWVKMVDTITCDTTLQQKGDPCGRPGSFACTPDFKQMLQCRDGVFDIYRYCRGQNGCTLKEKEDQFFCDESISELNDPCGRPGSYACSVDGKMELICQGGKFVRSRDCKRMGCHLTSTNRVDCN
jgi:hypothetical protein